MIDEILGSRKKRHVQDLNIVPILDMLTTVIFFLLMSTSFIEYTKLTLPPASTVTASGSNATHPLNPKLILRAGSPGKILVTVSWSGLKPDQITSSTEPERLVDTVRELLKRFSTQFPAEKTLQISLSRTLPYQNLISAMDGARDLIPDPVLASYTEADSK